MIPLDGNVGSGRHLLFIRMKCKKQHIKAQYFRRKYSCTQFPMRSWNHFESRAEPQVHLRSSHPGRLKVQGSITAVPIGGQGPDASIV